MPQMLYQLVGMAFSLCNSVTHLNLCDNGTHITHVVPAKIASTINEVGSDSSENSIPMKRKRTATASNSLLEKEADGFWEDVQVFPKAIKQGAAKDYKAQALTQLKKAGANCLRMLIEKAQLSQPQNATPEQLAAHLLAADSNLTIQYLAELIRGRGKAINEEYESHFSSTKRKEHQTHLDQLSKGRSGKLKLFAKLLLLYEDDHKTIYRVFVRKLWRTKKTTFEFAADKNLTPTLISKLQENRDSLADTLSDAFSGLDLRFFNTITLGVWEIFLIQREYSPAVRPDFRDVQKTLHGFGWIMFGLERGQHRIILKGGGQKAIPIIENWFKHKLKTALRESEPEPYSKYDAVAVESAFLGNKLDSSKVDLVAIAFHRTQAPQHSPMTVEPAFPGHDIRRDLQYGREKEVFRVRSLSDINWIRVRFQGKEATATVKIEERGATTLVLDNADMTESEVDELRKEFLCAFGVPLDQKIDPQKLLLGAVDIYNYLLETERVEYISHYQKKALRRLLDDNFLFTDPQEILVCPKSSVGCKLGGKPVIDDDVSECPECQTELEVRKVEYLRQNEIEIRRKIGDMLQEATGWRFSSNSVTFEKEPFYPLTNPQRPDQVIRVYFSKRVGKRILDCLDRSLQPVLVVHTGGGVDYAHLDAAGVAHVSFARALAAADDNEAGIRFSQDVENARKELVSRQEEKALRRAMNSRGRIEAPSRSYSGEEYELDIFNVLRSIFPYTEFWAGTNRPDGFCGLVYFDDGSLRKPVKFNWSYDAKFTNKPRGYDLTIGEERKAWDYVAALMQQTELQLQGNELNGHAIISNRLYKSQMKKVAKFIRREHRLGGEHPGFKVIFILDGFLKNLFDRIRSNELEFSKRRSLLSQRLAKLLAAENDDGYVLLNDASATQLTDWVLQQREIESPPDARLIAVGLSETMTES